MILSLVAMIAEAVGGDYDNLLLLSSVLIGSKIMNVI